MVFCILAFRKNLIPILWDWNLFLEEAKENLGFPYQNSDAEEVWGLVGVMLLRTTADLLYGGAPGITYNSMTEDIRVEMQMENEELFKDIGGVKNWIGLVNGLENHQHLIYNSDMLSQGVMYPTLTYSVNLPFSN